MSNLRRRDSKAVLIECLRLAVALLKLVRGLL